MISIVILTVTIIIIVIIIVIIITITVISYFYCYWHCYPSLVKPPATGKEARSREGGMDRAKQARVFRLSQCSHCAAGSGGACCGGGAGESKEPDENSATCQPMCELKPFNLLKA